MVNREVAEESLLCRGMRDLLPRDMRAFRRIEQVFLDTCRSWGYSEIRTPTIEHLYLFTSYGTLSPQLLGRVYSFLDWDGWTGERVVLRPDATIPVARVFREHDIGHLAKFAYVSNIFRFGTGDEPREVWQCGVELIGDTWPRGDVELIALAVECVQALGIQDVRISVSHSGVLRAILERAGFPPAEQAELYDRLLSGDQSVSREIEAALPALGPALRLLTGVQRGTEALLANLRSALVSVVPAAATPLDELDLVARTASTLGLPVDVSVTGVRDFEYYTGPVFHLIGAGHTVAAGGRYDGLILAPDGTRRPACGFAFAVDELLHLLPESAPAADGDAAEIVPNGNDVASLASALAAARSLHARGAKAALTVAGPRLHPRKLGGNPDALGYRVARGTAGQQSEARTIDEVSSTLRGTVGC